MLSSTEDGRIVPSSRPLVFAAAGVVVVACGALLVAAAIVADGPWFEDHWLLSYCTRSPATPALEMATRCLAAGLGVALMTMAGPMLGRRASRVTLASLSQTCCAIVLAVAVALAVSDGLLRLRHPPPKPAPDDPILPPMTVDATGNRVPLASTTKDVMFGGRAVRYAIDADGNRAASADHVTDPDAPTVLFTGESVGIGWGVAYEESYPALVAAALGLQAVNVAVVGFANDRAYLRARDALAKLSHPVALVTVALAEQLERNVDPRRDHLILSGEGRLEVARASESLWATSPLRNLGYHSSEAISLTRAILQATATVSRSRGAIPVFLWTNYGRPCVPSDRGVSRLEQRLFSGLDARRLRVDIAPEQTIIGDGGDHHPNQKGHQALAKAVLEALDERERRP